jgi:hypothetical protein
MKAIDQRGGYDKQQIDNRNHNSESGRNPTPTPGGRVVYVQIDRTENGQLQAE